VFDLRLNETGWFQRWSMPVAPCGLRRAGSCDRPVGISILDRTASTTTTGNQAGNQGQKSFCGHPVRKVSGHRKLYGVPLIG
jgi:hypothetical protein